MTPAVVAITDRRVASAERTLERFGALGRLARPGSVVFQLRDLELDVRERLAFGSALSRLARETEQLFVVNDRVDLAVLLQADGVHLGEASVSTADARSLLGPKAFVSRACHDPLELVEIDADAVLLSPVLEERKGRPALGLDALRRARALLDSRRAAPLLLALGGVTSETLGACRNAGADGAAMISGAHTGRAEALVSAANLTR